MKSYALRHKAKLILLLISLVVIGISAFASLTIYQAEKKAIVNNFMSDIDDQAALLHQELLLNLESLHGFSVMYSGEELPSMQRFTNEAKAIIARRKSIQTLEWIPKVKHSERKEFESKLLNNYSNNGFTKRSSQGEIIPVENKEEYYPIFQIEPAEGNEAAIGYDFSSSPRIFETLQISRNNAIAQATSSITLVRGDNTRKGFLVFLPIYNTQANNIIENSDNFKGFVLGVYKIDDIFTNALKDYPLQEVKLTLLDQLKTGKKDILIEATLTDDVSSDTIYTKALPEILGRSWILRAQLSDKYVTSNMSNQPLHVLLIGFIITILVFLYFQLLMKTYFLGMSNKKLHSLSLNDSLTNILNRRAFDQHISTEWKRAVRYDTSISLLLIDIDDFKKYNDSFGHQAGDECLISVVQSISNIFKREHDIVARYGGEEFAVILPMNKNTMQLAELCRSHVENKNIKHADYTTLTISIGVHTMSPKKNSNYYELIKATDTALYKAKNLGKNRVETAQPDERLNNDRLLSA